jgi:hypothetical protein
MARGKKKAGGANPSVKGGSPEGLYRNVVLWTEWFSDAGRKGDQELRGVLTEHLVQIAEGFSKRLTKDARAALAGAAATDAG